MSANETTGEVVETVLAAQQVIGARLPILSAAMREPFAADHGELSRMVTEKVAAFGASGRSAATAGDAVRRASGANARTLGKIAGGGAIWPADWLQLTEDNLAAYAALATLPMMMLKPVHGTVTANKRRLRR